MSQATTPCKKANPSELIWKALLSFRTVHGIGGDQYLRMETVRQVLLHIGWYLNDDISFRLFHFFQGICITGFLSMEDKIVASLNMVNQLLRECGTIVVDYIHYDILDFHIHHPRHHTHDDDRKHDDEFGQKSVTPDLQKFFTYEIFQCHYSNRLLNFARAMPKKKIVRHERTVSSCKTLSIPVPIIISLRMAEI